MSLLGSLGQQIEMPTSVFLAARMRLTFAVAHGFAVTSLDIKDGASSGGDVCGDSSMGA